ncbi:uncharacterized protein LOC122089065 [Macadamia integrifolia]|uniref:uncharacterized protein LOC122089065 n=1 Tax=Macadamia integrifolia TaxID=60698 RepID=UPI001C4F11B6|nr:uncharacterized protein LOC122089065 [Macadamia integrifolia]
MSKYSQEREYIHINEDEDGEEDDLCISIEGFHGETLIRSPMQNEKQISVDPISLRYGGPPLLIPTDNSSFTDITIPLYPPPLPPSKHKSVSASLPGSTTASPRSSTGLPQSKNVKKWKNQAQQTLGLSRFATENLFSRSKSFGEGRASAPSDEFDFFSRKLCSREFGSHLHVGTVPTWDSTTHGVCHQNEIDEENGYPEYKHDYVSGKKGRDHHPRNKDEIDIFKCGKCLFLPAFGRGGAKPVRARKDEAGEVPVVVERNVISRSVSLEKFECGSWTSSAIMNEDDGDRESIHHLYFDLPLELIQNCGNDANSPVTTAFLFDSDRSGAIARNNINPKESSRHVRFSSTGSSGSCITPRLRKARDDFNAFLQAQNA